MTTDMAYFKIVFDNNRWKGKYRSPIYVQHWCGSQILYCVVDDLIGDATNAWELIISLEIDGWGDDQACIGDVYETDEGFNVECISEEEYYENY